MSQGFSVFIEDVDKASRVFHQASIDYGGLMPKGGFPLAGSGDPACDKMISSTIHMIGEMHTVLAQALEQHGIKLSETASKYKYAEDASDGAIAGILLEMIGLKAPPLDKAPSF